MVSGPRVTELPATRSSIESCNSPLKPQPPKTQIFPIAEVKPKEYLGVGAELELASRVHDNVNRSNMNISLR